MSPLCVVSPFCVVVRPALRRLNMELELALGSRSLQAAFRELVAECGRTPRAASAPVFLVLAAIEVVGRQVRLEFLEVRGVRIASVLVGDYVFVITLTRPPEQIGGLLKRLLSLGKSVVWLVANPWETDVMRLLKRRRLLRRVEVRRVEDYLALRSLFTSWDRGISTKAAVRLILDRCRVLLGEANLSVEILVR